MLPKRPVEAASQVAGAYLETATEGFLIAAAAMREHPADRRVQALFTRSVVELERWLAVHEKLRALRRR